MYSNAGTCVTWAFDDEGLFGPMQSYGVELEYVSDAIKDAVFQLEAELAFGVMLH